MRRKKLLVVSVMTVAVILVAGYFVLRQDQEANSTETIKERYLRQQGAVMKETGITEKEFEEELLELVSLGRNELGHWREREESWIVKVGPDYQSYKIKKKEDYQELLKRIQIYVVNQLHVYLVKRDWSLSASQKIVRAKISGKFDSLIQKNEGVTEDLFHLQ